MSFIQKFPFFEPDLREEMESTGEVREFASGEIIIRTGQYVRATMLVLEGRVKIYREDEDGNEFFMYYLNAGEACALSIMCAARQEKSQVLAQADEASSLLMIPFQKVSEWMAQYASWYRFVVETYRNRFEEILITLDQVAFRSLDERLEFYLQRQMKAIGTPILHLTHQQIAEDLNSSREVVSRLLKKMEQRGKVVLSRNHIEVVDIVA
jgi:CRP/FNR family transcriptional regulator